MRPYFRIIEQTSPLTYIIKNQLDNTTRKAHVEQLRHAKIDDLEIPKETAGHVKRKATEDPSTDNNEQNGPTLEKRFRKERDIPLTELAKKIRQRNKDEKTKTYQLMNKAWALKTVRQTLLLMAPFLTGTQEGAQT